MFDVGVGVVCWLWWSGRKRLWWRGREMLWGKGKESNRKRRSWCVVEV